MGICGVDAGFALRPPLTRGPARQIVSLSSRTVLEGCDDCDSSTFHLSHGLGKDLLLCDSVTDVTDNLRAM